MRILLINYEFPPLGGGAGNATKFVSRELAKLGADVKTLTSAFENLPKLESVDGYEIHRVPVLRKRADRCSPFEMLTFILSARRYALRLAEGWLPDVSVAFFGIPSGPVSKALKRKHLVPYIVSLRGGDVPGFQPYELSMHHKLTGGYIRNLWADAGAVVANSVGLRDLAKVTAGLIPVDVIPNGVDSEVFHPAETKRSSDKVRILFVGRLVHQKGVDLLLRGLATSGVATNVQLTLIGDGSDRGKLEKMAGDLGIGSSVRFEGWKLKEELPSLYREADLFVLPSRDEGMPNAVLEAMASGLPVIASNIAGSQELVEVGRTGLLFESDHFEGLAECLSDAVADRERLRWWGINGRARVEAEYGWDRVADGYFKLAGKLAIEKSVKAG